jgi:hypothetical protein
MIIPLAGKMSDPGDYNTIAVITDETAYIFSMHALQLAYTCTLQTSSPFKQYNVTGTHQCFESGFGSGSAGIRIQLVARIRIRIRNADPDPGGLKRTKMKKKRSKKPDN